MNDNDIRCGCWPMPHVDGQPCRQDVNAVRDAFTDAVIEQRILPLIARRRRRTWGRALAYALMFLTSAAVSVTVIAVAARIAEGLSGVTP